MKQHKYIILLIAFLAAYGIKANEHTHDRSQEQILEAGVQGSIQAHSSELIEVFAKGDTRKLALYGTLADNIQFDVKKDALARIFDNGNKNITIEDFPIPSGQSGKLVLTKARPIYDANTSFVAGGKKVLMPIINSYHGRLVGAGIEENDVFLSIYDGELTGAINIGEEKYSIGHVNNGAPNGNLHIIQYTDQNENQLEGVISCGTDEYFAENDNLFEDGIKIDAEKNKGNANDFMEVRLTIVGFYDYLRIVANREGYFSAAKDDFEFAEWELSNDPNVPLAMEKALVYMVQVMEMTSRIYEIQSRVRFSLDSVVQYGTDDPLIEDQLKGQRVSSRKKLDDLIDHWRNRTNGTNLVVGFHNHQADEDSHILGLAKNVTPRKGEFCNRETGYCVVGVDYRYKYPSFQSASDIHTTAHELGHLFGVNHTHNYHWFVVDNQPSVRDTCVLSDRPAYGTDGYLNSSQAQVIPRQNGTLMSYCHIYGRVVSRFHPYIAEQYIRYAAQNSDCVFPVAEPTVRLTNHLGEEILNPGKNIISWVSQGVTTVDISYMLDGGEREIIAEGVNAAQGGYQWDVPQIETDNLIIEIYESGNYDTEAATYDRTLVPIKIQNKFLSITSPEEGAKFQNGKSIVVNVEKNLVPELYLQYRAQGGSWINADTTAGNVLGFIPPVELLGIVNLRVIDASDPTLNDEVQIEIGEPDGMIVLPSDGMTICRGWENYAFEFRAEFVERVTFEYSTDGGNEWKNVIPLIAKVDAIDNIYYVWPQVKDDGLTTDYRLRMRVLDGNSPGEVLDEVTGLIISDCPWKGVEEEDASFNSRITLTSIQPNPANTNATLIFNNTVSTDNAMLSVYDTKGELAYSSPISTVIGSNEYTLDTGKLAVGSYIVVIEAEGHSAKYMLQVNR